MTPELEQYIARHISPEPENLRKIDRLTNLRLVNGRMCSGHIQGRLLKMLTAMIRPARVLELGTFSGYSALCMAEALDGNATVDTIEAFDELEDFIRENLASSPAGKKVTLHIGNALEVMRQWKEPTFDLIFLDADKREYPAYLEACRPILRPGGFIIADNTLWDGHVLEENPSSAQTRAIKTFNDLAASDPDFETAIIPIRDGLTILRRK
ncbi:MAG: O-methyltransferase [Muribaculaceae bacterium]|nr:O-methyltransferase [Muribaculaceae bacterium]